jgi:hypothetical protein
MTEPFSQKSSETLEHYHSDLQARDQALGTFGDVVKTTFDPKDVEKWVSSSLVRKSLFDDMVVGQIRWPRSLGRPDTPNLSDGFVITTKRWVDIWHIGIDGAIVEDLRGWIPGVAPDVRDGLSTADHHSVHYLFHAPVDNDGEVEVKFSDVIWRLQVLPGNPKRHYLSSHGFQFSSDGHFLALPDITIDGQPFFHP